MEDKGPSNNDNCPAATPCGACKFLRRKCVAGCIFAPHFASDQGAARFAAVHKVFGASNVSKMLMQLPPNRRHDAVVTVCYEAQARLNDPVYGCVATVLALQQQVAALQTELSMVQAQLMSSRLAVATAIQNAQNQQIATMLQPPPPLPPPPPPPAAYNLNTNPAASTSNDLINLGDMHGRFGFVDTVFQHSQASELPPYEDDDDEEVGQNTVAFVDGIFNPK